MDPPTPRRRRWIPYLVALGSGAVVGVALLGLLSPVTGDVGPGRVELRAEWGRDHRTDLVVPPLGRISADTHRSPLRVAARIRTIDIEAARQLAGEDDPQRRVSRDAQSDLRPLIIRFVVRALLLAAVVGALAAGLLPWRRWSHLPVGALGGVLAVGGLFAVTAMTYDPEAFAQPRFEGSLAEAPRIIEAVQRNIEDFDAVRSRIDALGGQIGDLYASSVTEGLVGDPGEVRILHVSDIHLNPVGLEVAGELAEQFEVDAILDTGDLTTFGLPFESRVGELIDTLPVPYLIVPGNHDSDVNRVGLSRFENVTVLDPGVETVGDVRILGVGDPSFTATNELEDEDVQANLVAQQTEVADLVAETQPDVLAVHNRRQADSALGQVPLVLAGHIHEQSAEERDGSLVATAGSTGATGLGSFTVDTDLAYEASVLHFVDGRLTAIDAVSLTGTEGDFRIDRRVYGEETEV